MAAAQSACATQYTWRSAVRSGLFSNYNCWSYKDGNNQTQVADASHHLTTSDDFSFWLQPSAGYYYVTNDTSTAFNGGQFSFGMVDIAGNLTTQSKTHIRIATSGTAPRLAVVNKHDGNWTIGQDLYVGGSASSHAGNCGVFTNRSGNVYVESGWTYVGGNATGDNLPNATGVVVNVSGNIRTRSMIIGGAADNTSGTLDIQGGKVSVFVSDRLLDNKYWYSMVLATKPTSRATIRVAEGARFESEGSGHNIGMCDGPITIDIDGTFKINNGGLLNYQDNNNEGTNFVVTVGPTGRFEFRQVRGGRSGRRMLYLDGGTLAPQGDESSFLAYLSLAIKSDRDGKIEVPSGKTVDTGVWVSSLGSAKGALVKTGAGTLRITNYFRPAGGMKVRQGTLSILHNDTSFTSYDCPLAMYGTAAVTAENLAFGQGASLSYDCASVSSKPTLTASSSLVITNNIGIAFNTASPFGFDESYTLISGGRVTSAMLNKLSVKSAVANGVDITSSVYLATQSGNLVLKRKPYFTIKVR